MKQPKLTIEEGQPRNIQRTDITPVVGYGMVVDGHFKKHFSEETPTKEAAAKLLARYPRLKIEVYDASSKSRTPVK
jgi:hypothetical protein